MIIISKKNFVKNISLLLFAMLLLAISCTKKNDHAKNVIQYYKAFNDSNYNQIKSIIADSITLIEGPYTTTYSHETFHEFFKWDSIFMPTNKIIVLEELNDQILVTITANKLHFEFLKNNPLTCQYKVSFESDKITQLENIAFLGVDWTLWEKEKNALVNWIGIHHPELDGFINDMTMNGAINYLKAIELYKKDKMLNKKVIN